VPSDGQIRVAGARDRDPAAAADIAASAVIAVPMVHTRESKTPVLTPGFSILDVPSEELRTWDPLIWKARVSELSDLEHCRYAESIATLECSGLEFEA
jgi:hypothetical protein